MGEVERGDVTWRKAFKLNESAADDGRAEEDLDGRTVTGGLGAGGFDLVRPRGRAHANNPPLLDGLGGCKGECDGMCESGLLIVS